MKLQSFLLAIITLTTFFSCHNENDTTTNISTQEKKFQK